MTISQKGIDLIKQFEGCKLTSYQDQNGIWTIGYGHVSWGHEQQITQEQADSYLCYDLQSAEGAVNRFVDTLINQNQFDALVSFTYNVGSGSFKYSTLLKLLNSGNTSLAANEFLRWDKINEQVSEGLMNRRKAEQALFLS